ncbi:protein angel homolog 1 [Achroia grisella]|uniref:protein angel homolog 1 n=1 Tax=Achroia grisella TaxID=688607 RepID=UPI0027D2964F|nr:protein angel homolog 1 [Achroia grisella]
MLKLSNSFYRYLKVTESISVGAHVRNFTQLSCSRKKCSVESSTYTLTINCCPCTALQLRLLSSKKKRIRIQIPSLKSDESETFNQMSELQPNNNHNSHGGQLIDSPGNSVNEWQMQIGDDSPHDAKIPKTSVPPNFRVWEPVGKRSDTISGSSFKFKVLSYNVLAQYLLECHPYLYTGSSSKNLKWKVRAARIYDEIVNLAPDIICLQEVQASHLKSFYSKFENIGYVGIFKQKTGHRADGCAIYYKQSMFEKEEHFTVEFHQPELPILNRDNIGVMVKLIPKNMPRMPIVVATTHLLYSPKRTDVRLAQAQVLLAELDRFAYYNNGRESGHLPIIMTGDLNSTPDSAVIKLLDRGLVRASMFRGSSDWKRIGVTDNCQHLSVYLDRMQGRTTEFSTTQIYNSEHSGDLSESICASSCEGYSALFNKDLIGHSLNLVSVYNKYKPDKQREASTYQDQWVTVDYMYFSCCSALSLSKRLRLPTVAECEAMGCLPNDVYASDHLALAAVFELRPLVSSL